MQVTKNITLDLLETGSPVIIKAKQNDRNTRYISAHLYVDGLAYPVPNGTEIAFRYKKPDGTAGFYDALPDNSPAITVSGNTVTVELVEQVLTAAGCVHCEINMYNATSEKLTTFTFEIAVEESVLTDAEIISSDYYNVLTAEITKALQAVTDATEQAENAAQSAQDAADSAAMSKDWAAGQPVTYSGAPVSIAYAGTNRIASIIAYGENAQGGTTEAPVALTGVDSVQVCGNNLLPMATEAKTIYGVTFTPNSDGSVTIKGTATGWSSMVIDGDFSLPAGTYTLNSNTQTTGVGLSISKDVGGTQNIATSSTTSKTFTLPDLIKHYVAYIVVRPNLVVDTTIYPMLNLGSTAMPYEPYQGSVTQLPIPRPLRRVGDVKDKCVTRQDYESAEKLVVTYNVGYIASYAGESITTAWISSTGALSTGAEVAYVLSSPETYATDPVDFDNTAGPLTVMTGGELEVRITELVGTRSDVSNNTVAFSEASQDADIQTGEKLSVLFGKIKKRFSNIYNKTESDERYATAAQGEKADNALPKTGGTISGNLTVVQDLTVQRAFNGMRIKAGVKIITTPTTSARAELFNSDTLNTLFGTTGVSYTNGNCVVLAANGDYDFHPRVVTSGYVNSKWAVFTADAGNFTISTMRVNYIAIKFA